MKSAAIDPLVIERVPREGMKLACALMRDPAPLHWDDEEVQRQGLGDRAFNPGIINAAYVVQAVGRWAGGYGRVKEVSIRFESRLFADDRAIASGDIDAVSEQPDGSVRVSVKLESEVAGEREVVISGEIVVASA